MSDQNVVPVITIRPEPSPEELVAIVAAVASAIAAMDSPPPPETRSTSRWAAQGRLDAMQGLFRGETLGNRFRGS